MHKNHQITYGFHRVVHSFNANDLVGGITQFVLYIFFVAGAHGMDQRAQIRENDIVERAQCDFSPANVELLHIDQSRQLFVITQRGHLRFLGVCRLTAAFSRVFIATMTVVPTVGASSQA